jgi:hypothetical protein
MPQMPYLPFKNNSNGIRNVIGTPKQNLRLLGRNNESYKRLGMPNTQPK